MAGRELRVGIVGAARVATYAMIAPARAVDGVRVAAVASRNRDRAAAYAALHGIGRAHEGYDALIADPDVDLVYVATPPALHAAPALAAIAAGKPVLVEKPFTLTAAEARRLLDAAALAGVPVFEAMHSPHHALFKVLLELVGGGAIGAVRALDAEFGIRIEPGDDFRWQAALGGGALMDMGVYPLAWCRRLAGDAFEVTDARAEWHGGVDTRVDATLRFATGITAEVRASMLRRPTRAHLRILGEAGSIDVENPLSPQSGHRLTLTDATGERSWSVPGASTFEAQLRAVRATLLDGAPFPLPPDDPLRSMEAIDRVRAAMGSQDG